VKRDSSMFATLQTANLVLTGAKSVHKIGEEVSRFGKKALIVCDRGIAEAGLVERIKEILEGSKIQVGTFDKVEPEPRIELVHQCVEAVRSKDYEVLVGLGGGSSLDVTKGAAIVVANGGKIEDYLGIGLVPKRGIPTVLVPTTSGTGSEATKYAIFTAGNMKQGVIDPNLYANVAIVDPELTLSMPPRITAATGMDALCHGVETYTSLAATPISDLIAKECITLVGRSLRNAIFNGKDLDARSDMALGSFYGGLCLTNASVTAVHALSFPLGADYHVAHGEANAVMLPYVMRFNCLGNMNRFAEIAGLMGERVESLSCRQAAERSADAVETLMKDIRVPYRLRDLKIPREAIPSMAERAFTVQRLLVNNPRAISLKEIIEIYEQAY
jgi:alcohol dehydrogenase class IV